MGLAKEFLAFLDMPELLNKQLKEIENIMSKVQELTAAFEEMKLTLADEASELWSKFDELQAQIDARVDPSSLEPLIADIRGTISNVEALSEGRPVAPAPVEEVPVEEPAPVEETPVEPAPVEEAPVEEPTPVEEPMFPTEPTFPSEEIPAEETPVEPTPAEGGDGSAEEPTF